MARPFLSRLLRSVPAWFSKSSPDSTSIGTGDSVTDRPCRTGARHHQFLELTVRRCGLGQYRRHRADQQYRRKSHCNRQRPSGFHAHVLCLFHRVVLDWMPSGRADAPSPCCFWGTSYIHRVSSPGTTYRASTIAQLVRQTIPARSLERQEHALVAAVLLRFEF